MKNRFTIGLLSAIMAFSFAMPTNAQINDYFYENYFSPRNQLIPNQVTPNQSRISNQNSQNTFMSRANQAGVYIFPTAIKVAGLDQQISQDGPFTIFAPSDNAIKRLPADMIRDIASDNSKITRVLNNHIVKGNVTSRDTNNQNITTVDGMKITVTRNSDGTLSVNGQKVLQGVRYSNGTIYVIDGTIMPENP